MTFTITAEYLHSGTWLYCGGKTRYLKTSEGIKMRNASKLDRLYAGVSDARLKLDFTANALSYDGTSRKKHEKLWNDFSRANAALIDAEARLDIARQHKHRT